MRIFPAVVLLVLVTACGSVRAPVTADEFTDRAREVAERWHSSAEREPWTAGFVPLRNLTVEPDWGRTPRWVGRSTINSAWKLETELPAEAPARAELRWADGGTLSVPVLAATAAYAGLSKPTSFADEKCPAKGCRPLRVIEVARGEATVPSSRGEVRVPTWDFTVKGVPEPFRRVAVDPAVMGGPPRPPDDGIQEVGTYEVLTPAELRLSYLHGTCDTTYGSRAHETPEAVVVDVDVRHDDVEACNAMGKTDRIGVTLREPFGPQGGAGLQQRGAPAAAQRHPPGRIPELRPAPLLARRHRRAGPQRVAPRHRQTRPCPVCHPSGRRSPFITPERPYS